jgi:hypothetical protein
MQGAAAKARPWLKVAGGQVVPVAVSAASIRPRRPQRRPSGAAEARDGPFEDSGPDSKLRASTGHWYTARLPGSLNRARQPDRTVG